MLLSRKADLTVGEKRERGGSDPVKGQRTGELPKKAEGKGT